MNIEFSHGLAKLNEEQHKVVTANQYENQRILASAGSGKTTTITSRISWLIERCSIQPEQILLATFSRNASREMTHRIHALCGPVNIWSGTFHALAKQVLTKYEYPMIRDLYFIDELPVKWTQWMLTEKGRKWVGSLRYVIVDEFQDINQIQWRLLETMRHPGVKFIIVGDDAQNIYTWRGSSAKYLLDYHLYVKSVVDYQLRMNYRSTEALVAVANRVMLKIPTLDWKQTMISAQSGGQKPEVLFFWRLNDECTWIARTIKEIKKQNAAATIAVLARNNVDLYRIEEILLQESVKCRFLSQEGMEVENNGSIDLSTFHGSKGLEWDVTFCICLSDDRLPGRKKKEEIIHERRLFYVGITRAKKRLFLSYHGNERHLSRFVREIGYSFLQFHGLAKYALSDVELGEQQPSLKSLLDCVDGDDWQLIREKGLLPSIDLLTLKEVGYIPFEDTWKPPSWCDIGSFQAFLHLFIRRCIHKNFGWKTDFQESFLERLIFRIRIFAEDASFWLEWQDELTEMVKEFFADSAKMPPAGYSDIYDWTQRHGLNWTQKDCIAATSILAKIRGQLRPLRFDKYSLDEFTICPTRIVVPTEYRAAVLRSWRKVVNPAVDWRECIEDIWRLSALYLVAEGRNAALYKVPSIVEHFAGLEPFLATTETFLTLWLTSKQECLINPECAIEGINPVHCDCFLDSSLVVLSGFNKADLSLWIESLLKAYCFITSGFTIESIQIVNPFRGTVCTFDKIPLTKLHNLYSYIFALWAKKNNL